MTQRDQTMRLTRRAALGAGAASAVVAALATAPLEAWAAAAASAKANQLEPAAGSWRTWVLESGSQLRPPAPPDRALTRSEIDTLRAMTAERDAAALDQVSYWDSGAPGSRTQTPRPPPYRRSRTYAG